MERKLRTLSGNHSDRDGDLLPEFDDGRDNLPIIIPPGKKYSRCVLVKNCFLGDCRITTMPRFGSTGRQRFRVTWNYASFGKANYDLKVYVIDANDGNEPLIINFGSHLWEEKARDAVNSGRKVKIRVTGPQALLLYPLIWNRRSRDLLNRNEQLDSREAAVAMTLIICGTIATVLIFAGLAAMIMHATQNGKCSTASTGPTNLLGGELGGVTIDIRDCSRGEMQDSDNNPNYEEDENFPNDEEEIIDDNGALTNDKMERIEGMFIELLQLLKKK